MVKIIDGKKISQDIRNGIKDRIAELNNHGFRSPSLTVVLAGDNPASVSYVTGKEKACAEVGIKSNTIRLAENTSEAELMNLIDRLNSDDQVDGILVQLPLPAHINAEHVIERIDPAKDVDGFTAVNTGKMVLGKDDCFIPCTPNGIIKLFEASGIDTAGKKVTVIGRSNIVGKPLVNLLCRKQNNATVTWCHTGTAPADLHAAVGNADIVIAATGCMNVFSFFMLKKDSVLIDVGVNRVPDSSKKSGFRLVGDIYDSADEQMTRYFDRQNITYTPVPGGVGPMTITMLMFNTLKAFENHLEIK